MEVFAPQWFTEALAALVERRELSTDHMHAIMQRMITGRCAEHEAAVLLVALRMKGETAGEIAAAAEVLRGHMIRAETGRDDVLDTCGTGGSGRATFNISTATAFVAAGAGVPVVKHGNRAITSSSGSADVLAALGVNVREDPTWVRACLDRAGLAFCFAPHFHPGMRYLASVRRHLKIRTLLNYLGPLANPAGAPYQLLGVGRAEFLDPMANALVRLGTRCTLLVCGRDGLDEVSLSGPTLVREVRGSKVKAYEWTPEDFGFDSCPTDALAARGPSESAAMIRAILGGEESPAASLVLANAAAALLAAERVGTLTEGVIKARASIRSGHALTVLERLLSC